MKRERRLPRWLPAAGAFAVVAIVVACAPREPILSFLDDESGISFTHPPRWNVGAAQQGAIRYRYLTAPRLEGDREGLSVTFIAPTAGATAADVAKPYLEGATGATPLPPGQNGASEWAFNDASGIPSRLRLMGAGATGFFGAWVRGSTQAMTKYRERVDAVLSSIRFEDATQWPEERFSGLVAHVPPAWTRGSRLANATNAAMQFKSLPLFVEKGTATVHGFITVAREPAPTSDDLGAFARMLKDRASDTVATIDHQVWPAASALNRPAGFMDYFKSGNSLTSTRIRRWIAVRGGTGLVFTCEARADIFDRLEPWCARMAPTVGLE